MNDAEVVRVLLEAAGITPSDKEIELLGKAYPGLQREVDRLYAVDTGDLPPAGMLRATG